MISEKDRLEQAKVWYENHFKGCGGETLPVSDGDPNAAGSAKKRIGGETDSRAVRDYCKRHSFTEEAFFAAAFGLALCSFTYSEQVVFTAALGRTIPPEGDQGGATLNGAVPLCLSPEGKEDVREYIRSCQDVLSDAEENGIYAYPRIGEDYNIRGRISLTCSGASRSFGGKEEKGRESVLAVFAGEEDGKMVYDAVYDPASCSAYTAAGILRLLDHISGEMLCRENLSDITLVSEKDEQDIRALYDTAYPVADRPAYRLLQDTAKAYPERVAVVATDRTLTYQELNEEANALGWCLKEAGAGPDTIVAVLSERKSTAYVMRQGVLKSGGAFLPVDPEYPEDRITFILEDAGIRYLVTTKEILEGRKALFDRLAETGIRILCAGDAVMKGDSADLNVPVPPEALAYVIYTSGSTGRPKGVMLTNKNLVNFVDDNDKNHEILGYTGRGSVSLAVAALTFDVSIMEEFIPLSHGMTSVLATREEIMDPASLSDLMIRNRVDLMTCTPSYLMNLLDMGRLVPQLLDAIKQLKSIDVGAEAFPPALYHKLREANPDVYIMNGYGPTETTISCTMKVIDSAEDITIGRPNANVSVCTIDRNQKLQPPGAMGEMVILGDGVGRGYIGRDDLTAKCFIRMLDRNAYRSGDLVRIQKDGNIAFHGRIDNQVKLRGLRIELGEVESVIHSYPGVRSCIAVVLKQQTDYLAAYFTADEEVEIAALKKHLSSRLTEYMVPQALVQLPKMPLTANGKIDKSALPVPGDMGNESYEAPATEMERSICEKMALALGLERVGVNDDFFAIGGSSITTIRLILECGHPGINNASIYKYRTPGALASYCESMEGDMAIDQENEAAMKEALPLPRNMEKYLTLQLSDPGSVYCNDAMLFRLKEGIDITAFASAVNKVFSHHPVLCMKMIKEPEGYRQVYDGSLFRPVLIEDLSAEEWDGIRESLVQPFPMTDSRLWRSRILRVGKEAFFFLEMHHIMCDGYSFQVLFEEIYRCFQDPDAVLEPDYYFCIMKRTVAGADTEEWREAEEYSRKLFEKVGDRKEEDLSLRTDHEAFAFAGDVRMKPLPFPKEGPGDNVLFMTACALAACEYNHSDRALIRIVSEARNDIHRMHSVGLYANYYPAILVKDENATPNSLISDMAEQVRFIDSHVSYPYFDGHIEDTDRLMRFIYQKDIDDLGAFGELVAEEIPLDTDNENATDSMCGVSVVDIASMKELIFLERYSRAHYDPESMDRLYELFCKAFSYLTEGA